MMTYTTQHGCSKDEAFLLTRKFIHELFVQLRTLQSKAQDVSTDMNGKRRQYALCLWTSMRAHKLMQDFISVKFIAHPSMAAIITEHILSNRLNPKQVKTLED